MEFTLSNARGFYSSKGDPSGTKGLMSYLNIFFLSQGKWDVPLPKVKAVGEDEVFKVIKTGRSKSKSLGV